jgi:hypothetical protein
MYQRGDEAEQQCELPLRMKTDGDEDLTVRFELTVDLFSPSSFLIVPDDCLDALIVNGQAVDDPSLPVCDYTNGAIIDLSPVLWSGRNTVEAIIRNNGGDAQFLIKPSWTDPLVAIPVAVIALAVFCFFTLLLARYGRATWPVPLVALFILATALRIFYLSVTPYWIRGHDTDGHIEYIEHLLTDFTLPSPNAGWESWQPPLYYTTAAAWASPLHITGFGRETILFWVQLLSLLLSIWTLLLIVQIGTRLFPTGRARTVGLPLFFGLVAFMPSLVMLTARINNDVLQIPLAFLAILFLIEWWRSGKTIPWLGCMLAIGLAVLSKSNGLLLLPAAFLCLPLRYWRDWKRMFVNGAAGLLIVLLVAGWFSAYRHFSGTGQDLLVGNDDVLNSALGVDNGPLAYLTFNPIEMVRIPFNNAWEDAARRMYFWEYLYRSAFFGEFGFGDERKLLASWVIAVSLPVFLIAVCGWFAGWRRWREDLPMLLIAVFLLFGHAAFRFRYPFSSSQDFRYIVPFLLPVGYFAVRWWTGMKEGHLKNSLLLCMQMFIVLCAVFQLHT